MKVEGLWRQWEETRSDAYRLELRPEGRNAPASPRESPQFQHGRGPPAANGGPSSTSSARPVLLFTAAIRVAVALHRTIVSIPCDFTGWPPGSHPHHAGGGASEGFIRVPFLSEGVLQAFFAGLLALGALYGATRVVASRFQGVEFLSPAWCGGFLLAAVLLGLVGSSFSVRHVLRQANI
jgi:hypothetical protein